MRCRTVGAAASSSSSNPDLGLHRRLSACTLVATSVVAEMVGTETAPLWRPLEAKLLEINGSTDLMLAMRSIVIGNLPEELPLCCVMAHVRGGMIITVF